MQSIYGSIESIYIDGTGICPMLTWDAKITTYVAVNGGTAYWTKMGLQSEGTYNRFISQIRSNYGNVFGDDVDAIKTNYEFSVPTTSIPMKMSDFENCGGVESAGTI